MPLKVKRHKKRKPVRPRNAKRIRRKMNKIPKIKSKMLEAAWNDRKSVRKNLTNMGLAYDPNVTVSRKIKKLSSNEHETNSKTEVAKVLESEAKMPRIKNFKFSQGLATYFTYLIKKYGDDYKAMAKDSKNVYQETWKQIRRRIHQFKTLEQYKKFTSSNK